MSTSEIKGITDPKERAIQAALCSELSDEQRCWFAFLACAIGLETFVKQEKLN